MTICRKTLLKVSSASAILPIWLIAPAAAQSMQPSQSSEMQSGPSTGEQGLADIIVTAQQRGENLQKAAVPLSVVSGSDLLKLGISGVESLQKSVPSLQTVSGGQGNIIFIRGVGNFSFLPSSDPAAAFNYDGIYVGRSSSTVGAFFDLERIEVLKGPQGTLYGRNATAGAINVLPAQPKIGSFSGYATATYGNFDAVTAEGALNVPLGDNAAFRVAGTYLKHDGYLKDGTSADDSGAVRAQLKVELSPALTVRLSADYAHQGGVGGGATYLGRYRIDPATSQFVVSPSGLSTAEGLFSPASQAYRATGAAGSLPGRGLDPLARLPYQDFDIYGVHAQIDLKTSLGTLTVIPAWRHARKDNFNIGSAQNIGDTQDSNQYSIEARLVSNPGKVIDYIIGAYYFSEQIDDDTHNNTGAVSNYLIARYTTKSPSAYGRLTLHATDRLRFTGGLRYTQDRKSFDGNVTTLAVVCTIAANCPTAPLLPYTLTLGANPVYPSVSGGIVPLAPGVVVRRADTPTTGRLKTSKLTYRGAVEFDLAERSLAYVSIESGYRAGGFNNDAPYAPENITAYTIGIKNRFFDNRLQLNAELFDWEYKDQQLTFLGIDGTNRVGVITRNIGRSRIRGAEIEALFRPLTNTTLSGAVQYVDGKYKSFVYQTPSRPFVGCAVTPAGPLFTVDCSGKRLFNSPKWTVNLAAEQVFPLGDMQLTVGVDTQFRSSRETGFEYLSFEHQPANWISNAQISFGPADGKWSIGAYVRNIENDRYQVYATPVPGSNLISAINAAPRTYGARLSARF